MSMDDYFEEYFLARRWHGGIITSFTACDDWYALVMPNEDDVFAVPVAGWAVIRDHDERWIEDEVIGLVHVSGESLSTPESEWSPDFVGYFKKDELPDYVTRHEVDDAVKWHLKQKQQREERDERKV